MRDTGQLEALIDALGKLSRAEREQWHLHVEAIKKLRPIAMAVAGDCTAMLASAAITYARQMPRASTVNEVELRSVAMSMSVILANELAAAGGPERAYYAREV